MNKKIVIGIALCSVAAVSMADNMRFIYNGNWENPTGWYNHTTAEINVAGPLATDDVNMNWGGGTCTLNSIQTVNTVAAGSDEEGHLIIANGGNLTATGGGSNVGRNQGRMDR